MYQEIIQKRLIAERKAAGYSQQALADEIQELQSKIAKIESGARAPDVETLGKLAEFYGISIDWLFGLGQKRPTETTSKRGNTEIRGNSMTISQHNY